MQGVIGVIRLTRPVNCLGALSSVLVGGYFTTTLMVPRLWLAALAVALLTAAGNVINDYFDFEGDCINKPARPLPSGLLSQPIALRWALVLTTGGIAISLFLSLNMIAVTVLMTILLYLYSWDLKKRLLIGHIAVALMSAMTIIYGGMAVSNIGPTLAPAAVIFLFMLCREILKTVEDIYGDRSVGVRTIAVVWGNVRTIQIFSFLTLFVTVIMFLPWLYGDVSGEYLLIVVPFINVVMLFWALKLMRQPTQDVIRKTLVSTKLMWFLWTIAMFVGVGLR